MIKLYDSDITDILPEIFANDPKVIALGYAIKKAMQRFIEYCRNTSVYAVIDTAPNNVLNMLALELGTQYYDDSLDIETKRRLIKRTLVWYMSSGTPAAVEELVAAVFGEGEVKEWFEYGDDPYYFKIITNAAMTPEMNEQFSAMLKKVKNARSHIRAIEIHRTVDQTVYAAQFTMQNYRPAAIIDGYEVEREAKHIVNGVVAGHATSRPAPIVDGFKVEGEVVQGYMLSGAAMAATEKQAAIREGLQFSAKDIMQTTYGIAAAAGHQKAEAVTENLAYDAEPVNGAITAGVAADSSIYKNTITE